MCLVFLSLFFSVFAKDFNSFLCCEQIYCEPSKITTIPAVSRKWLQILSLYHHSNYKNVNGPLCDDHIYMHLVPMQ